MKNSKIKLNQVFQKKSCRHEHIVFDFEAGEQFCRECGVVLVEKMVDFVSELHSQTLENSRIGPKSTLKFHDRGLSTDIGKSNQDSSGNPISPEMKNKFRRMRTWDSRSKNYSSGKRNLRNALLELNKLAEKMSLSDAIVERASYFYRKITDKGLVRGRSVKAAVGASLHAACRDLGTNRTITEISQNLHERRRNVAKTYRAAFQNLEISVPRANIEKIIVRISNNLKTSEKIKRDAILIYETLRKKRVTSGKKPNGVAATVIYMASIRNKENISQQEISKVSGITKITIRNRYRGFKKFIKMV